MSLFWSSLYAGQAIADVVRLLTISITSPALIPSSALFAGQCGRFLCQHLFVVRLQRVVVLRSYRILLNNRDFLFKDVALKKRLSLYKL
jgi:hypothetical protein